MYIEFKLPSGALGMAAQHRANELTRALAVWSSRYGIDYSTQLGKQYTLQVTLDCEESYTVFALTWTSVSEWRIVSH